MNIFIIFQCSILYLFLAESNKLSFSFRLLISIQVSLNLVIRFSTFFRSRQLRYTVAINSPISIYQILCRSYRRPATQLIRAHTCITSHILIIPTGSSILTSHNVFGIIRISIFCMPQSFIIKHTLNEFVFIDSFFCKINIQTHFFCLFLLCIRQRRYFKQREASLIHHFLRSRFC